MFNRIALLSIVAAIGCVQATVEDRVVKTTEVALPDIYQQYNLPQNLSVPKMTVNQSVPFDVSDAIRQVSQAGDISVNVYQNTLTAKMGSFSFVDEIKLVVMPDNNNNSNLPALTMIDVVLTQDQKAGMTLDLPVLADSATLSQYFESGGLNASFAFTIEGVVPLSGIDVENTLGLDVSLSLDKSVSDIGK